MTGLAVVEAYRKRSFGASAILNTCIKSTVAEVK